MREKRSKTKAGAATIGIAMLSIGACMSSFAQGGTAAWRCGNAYSDRPCEGGEAVRVDDNRSAQDRRDADTGTRNARTQAEQMERSRLSLEKAAHDRDQRAAREARSAALAERRLAMAEQKERDRARKLAGEPRKPSATFKAAAADNAAGEAPKKKKKRKSAGSDAA